MAEVRVGSLMEALMEIVVGGRTHDRRVVRVAGLRPRDVAVLEDVVLRIARERPFGDKRWKLAEAGVVRKTKQVAEMLVVLERVLLPSLAYQDARALIGNGTLIKYINVLSPLASAAGDFGTNVKVLCARLRDYIDADADAQDDAELHPLVDHLMEDVTALLDNLAFPERAINAAPANEPLAINDVVPAPGRRRKTGTTTAGIRPDSLDAAFKDMAITFPNHSRRNVWVQGLCPRDVFALLTVAEMARKLDNRWTLRNKRRLLRMERAVGMLLALEAALLPALTEYRNDTAPLLAAVRIYAMKLSKEAMGVGGTFSANAGALCKNITEFVNNMEDAAASDESDDADAGEAAAGDTDEAAADEREQKLKALLAPLIAEVTRLLNGDVTVAQK